MKDSHALWFYGGLISLHYLAKILKKIIKQSRPIPTHTYGMPSTKSATVFYIAMYLILTNRLHVRTQATILMLAIVGILYKLYYKEHSLAQIGGGAFLGICYAFLIRYLRG